MPCPQVACGAAISSPECELLLAASAVDVAMYKQVRRQGAGAAALCAWGCALATAATTSAHHGRLCPALAGLSLMPCGAVQVEAEASIPDHHRFYCPSPHCSTPLHLESDPAPDSPISCPACSTKTCAWCRTVWHKGFSCQEYRVRLFASWAARSCIARSPLVALSWPCNSALPVAKPPTPPGRPLQELPCHLRQPEDLALLSVAQRRRWQQCGKCKHMIELGEGCRHITCKCGYEFCYSCGKPWQKVPGERSRQTCEPAAAGHCRLPARFRAHAVPRNVLVVCVVFQLPTAPRRLGWTTGAGRCELFDTTPVRDEAEAEPEPEPAPAPPAPPPDASAVPPWVPHHVRPVYKTKLCMYHPDCHRGDRCWFAHGAGELREPHWLGSTPRTRGAPSDSTDSDSDSDWL